MTQRLADLLVGVLFKLNFWYDSRRLVRRRERWR